MKLTVRFPDSIKQHIYQTQQKKPFLKRLPDKMPRDQKMILDSISTILQGIHIDYKQIWEILKKFPSSPKAFNEDNDDRVICFKASWSMIIAAYHFDKIMQLQEEVEIKYNSDLSNYIRSACNLRKAITHLEDGLNKSGNLITKKKPNPPLYGSLLIIHIDESGIVLDQNGNRLAETIDHTVINSSYRHHKGKLHDVKNVVSQEKLRNNMILQLFAFDSSVNLLMLYHEISSFENELNSKLQQKYTEMARNHGCNDQASIAEFMGSELQFIRSVRVKGKLNPAVVLK